MCQVDHANSSVQQSADKMSNSTRFSPSRFLFIITGGIFLAEVIAMLIVIKLRALPYYLQSMIDATIMVFLIFPVLYFFSFRPLLRHIEQGRRAEETLLRSKELQERFFDSIDILIAYMDRDFNFIRVNEAYARSDGRQPEYFIGKNHFALYPHTENQAIFQRVLETREAFFVYEKPFEYPENPARGVTYWDWSLQPVKGVDGNVEGLVLSLLDVTERRRAQDVIHQLSRIVEQTEDTVVVTDCDGVIEYVNPAFERLTGYTKEEALGKTPRVLKSGIHDNHFYQELWNTILKGDVFQSEIANRKKNGDLFYEVKTITPLRDAQGNIINFVATGKDITEHKYQEEELSKAYDELELRVHDRTEELRLARDELELHVQERTEELAIVNRELMKEIAEREVIERKLRLQTTAMDAAANGIVITDCQGSIQWTNPALVQISGYETRDMIGQNMHIFRSGQHDTDFYRRMWDTILSGQVWRGEITNRRKDGSLYIEEQTITPVRDDQDQVTQFIAIKQDITERKQAEKALRASEEKFRTLVDWTYDWEFWVDPQGNIVYTSPSCQRMTGYSPDEFVANPDLMISIIHREDRSIFAEHQKSIHSESAGVEKMEYRILTREGQECWIEHICRPLYGAEDQYLGRRVSNRDITERKLAEKTISERNQKEKLLRQTIHTMQLDIARDLHDTIGQNISFLRMKLDHLAEKKISKQAELQLEIRGMAGVANESYDLMRGTLAVLQSENSTDLFRLFTRFAEQIEERSSFKIDLATQGEPRFVSAKRMRQLFYIFREILNNIEKHANASQVTIQMAWDSDCLKLVVFDNGCGFDLDGVQYGSHYGLLFMRERVELLNGSILIRSAIGSGTDIILQVPYE